MLANRPISVAVPKGSRLLDTQARVSGMEGLDCVEKLVAAWPDTLERPRPAYEVQTSLLGWSGVCGPDNRTVDPVSERISNLDARCQEPRRLG